MIELLRFAYIIMYVVLHYVIMDTIVLSYTL